MTAVRAWLRALWFRLWRDPEPYPSEAAGCDCPKCDTVGGDITTDGSPATCEALPVERAQPWTGDNVTVNPAVWVPDSQLIREVYAAIDAYRHGQDPGGAPELSPLTRWTERGWRPIADWRLARTDKRWW